MRPWPRVDPYHPRLSFVFCRLSLVLYFLVYCFRSLVYTPSHPFTSLHQVLSLSSFVLVVRPPTYLYTRYSCIRVFYKYYLYNLVLSINDVLETGYQNGVVARDKALCLDFVLDVVHFCFHLVYCLIILLVSAYAWFLVLHHFDNRVFAICVC